LEHLVLHLLYTKDDVMSRLEIRPLPCTASFFYFRPTCLVDFVSWALVLCYGNQQLINSESSYKWKCVRYVYYINIMNCSVEEYLKGYSTQKSFTHPQVVANLYEFPQKKIFWRTTGTLAPLTSIVFVFLLWKSMVPNNCLVLIV